MANLDVAQRNVDAARWLLRVGLAFVYGYASVEMRLNPGNFLKYVPAFVQNIVPINIFLLVFGIFEAAFALWLLSGKFTQYAGVISFILMMAIIFPNLDFLSVLFRNFAIAFASLALTVLDLRKPALTPAPPPLPPSRQQRQEGMYTR